MTKSINVIFHTDNMPIVENLPEFQRVFEYPILDELSVDRREWGRIRSEDDFVRFLSFSKIDIDASAAFNGGKSDLKPISLERKFGVISVTVPTLSFLNEAVRMIMYTISNNMTVYPPDFKIFTEMSPSGGFFIKYEVK